MIIGNKIHIGSRRKVHNGSKLNPAFQITVDTTKAGSASDTFVLPTNGAGYNALVKWGDGTEQTITGTPGNVSHTYPVAGTYQISITGDFPRIYFNNRGDKLKLMSIDNWGRIVWGTDQRYSYSGCQNVTAKYKDIPNFNNVQNLSDFASFSSFYGSVKNFVKPSCNVISQMFLNVVYNHDPSSWDTSNVSTFFRLFRNCYALKTNGAWLNIKSATDLKEMFYNVDINEVGTTSNYDNMLTSLAQQAETYNKSGLSFHGGNSKYSAAAQSARDYLVNTKGWTITDGGLLV